MSRAGPDMIRVLLADDEQLIRQGFRRLLEMFDDVLVVAEAADERQALRRALRASISTVVTACRSMRRCPGAGMLDCVDRAAQCGPRWPRTYAFEIPAVLEAARRGAEDLSPRDINT